jgi:transcription initiation factor IIF auxiliary subunit
MYHIIFGDIEFTTDENWHKEALIHEHHFTVICLGAEEAESLAEEFVNKHDYIIYEMFEGRMYNLTNHPIEVTERVVLEPKSKMEVDGGRKEDIAMG